MRKRSPMTRAAVLGAVLGAAATSALGKCGFLGHSADSHDARVVALSSANVAISALRLGDAPFTVSTHQPDQSAVGFRGADVRHTLVFSSSDDRPIRILALPTRGFWGPRSKPVLGLHGPWGAFSFSRGEVGFGSTDGPTIHELPASGMLTEHLALVAGLPGMGKLREGRFIERWRVRYWVADGPEERVDLRMVYDVTARV